MVDSLNLKYSKPILVKLLKLGGTAKKNDLAGVTSGWPALDKTLAALEKDKFISMSEKFLGRRTYVISLTDKGVEIAKMLQGIFEVAEDNNNKIDVHTLPPNYEKQFKNFSALAHSNVLDDHVAIEEHNYDGKGNDRVVFVHVKPNGNNIMRLWCEVDETFDCVHTKYAWSLPDVQAMVQIQYAKGNINKVKND